MKTVSSALFRHEIAYVLGQLMQDARPAIPALIESVKNESEHPMVRHEAAEALGSISSGSQEVNDVLTEFQSCKHPVVSESCDVALDMDEYWTNKEV